MNGIEETRIPTRAKKAISMCDVYAIRNSHYVIDVAGDLWSWGTTDEGQLGHGDTDDREAPKLIDALKGKQIKEVSVGQTEHFSISGHNYLPSRNMACSEMATTYTPPNPSHNNPLKGFSISAT